MPSTALRRPASLDLAALRGGWRWCVSLFTLLAFVLVVATAGAHIHTSTAAAHDCAVCSAVVDAVADVPVVPALVHHLAATAYLLTTASITQASFAAASLLPPSCGPPLTSV